MWKPTHQYLNIRTGEWVKVEFISIADLHHAYVRTEDNKTWYVGRIFLEDLRS
jgi:hypothetical protein